MEIITLLFLFLIPILAIAFSLRFKGFMSIVILAPTAMLFIVVIILSTDPTVTFLNSPTNSNHTTTINATIPIVTHAETFNRTVSYDVQGHDGNHYTVDGSADARAEGVANTNSVLHGERIDCIDIPLKKFGSPTGTATVGVFDGSGNVIKTFASIDVTTLSTTDYTTTPFCLEEGDYHTLVSTNRFGVKYTAGDASNGLNVRWDATAPFDGLNTVAYSLAGTTWNSFTGFDAVMRLTYLNNEVITTVTETQSMITTETTEFNQSDNSVTYTLDGRIATIIYAMTFAVGGLLLFMVFKRITAAMNGKDPPV